MPVRRLPHVGERVTVAFFGAAVQAVIGEFDERQRRLCVLTDEGEAITFTLSRATAQFVAEGNSAGARLLFHDRPSAGPRTRR